MARLSTIARTAHPAGRLRWLLPRMWTITTSTIRMTTASVLRSRRNPFVPTAAGIGNITPYIAKSRTSAIARIPLRTSYGDIWYCALISIAERPSSRTAGRDSPAWSAVAGQTREPVPRALDGVLRRRIVRGDLPYPSKMRIDMDGQSYCRHASADGPLHVSGPQNFSTSAIALRMFVNSLLAVFMSAWHCGPCVHRGMG